MAINPAGRFPSLPVPIGQGRLPAQTGGGIEETGIRRPAGTDAQAELLAETIDDRPGGHAPRPGQITPLDRLDPNAPRGTIIDILV
jgi:hypothetical protein